MTVQGIKSLKAKLKRHPKATTVGLRRGLYRGGLYLQRMSQMIVPVDTATLKGSANTRLEGEGLGSAAVVGYGTDYAVYVHEDLEARHKPGKAAKFLETPLREKRDKIAKIVHDAIKEALP